jgi:hypothetical protein
VPKIPLPQAFSSEKALTPTENLDSIARMNAKTLRLALAVSFLASAACFAANPQMGTWKLDDTNSKLAPGMGKSTTVIYTQKGDKIQVAVDGVDKNGKPTHGVWLGKWDGKAYKATGNLPWDSAAYRVVNDYSNNITTMKNGKVAWTGTVTVSKDGKSRTVTIHGTDANGKKFMSEAVYHKA